MLMTDICGDKKACELWAVAGGKGGTGKSFVSSSVGSCLARDGKRVVLLDADIGGANLHSLLGIDRPKHSLAGFFEKGLNLNDLIVDTGIENLNLITGNHQSFNAQNIKHFQKLKFFRHIKAIDADFAILDLGGSSHLNTLDTFLLADKMIVVLMPEITSVENMYQFVKSALFRKLKLALDSNGLHDVMKDIWKTRDLSGFKNLRDLIDHLKSISGDLAEKIDRELAAFKLYIIVNQVRNNEDIQIGSYVRSILKKYLGFNSYYVGYVEHDRFILESIKKRKPFLKHYNQTNCARELERITHNILEDKQIKVGSR